MLDSAGDDLPDDFEQCLVLARAIRAVLRSGIGEDHERVLAVLGATIEGVLKEIEDPDEQAELTLLVVETLCEHMGLRTNRAPCP